MNRKRKSKELNEVSGSAECWRWKIHLICPKRPLGLPWAQSFWISDTQCFHRGDLQVLIENQLYSSPLSLLKAKTLPPAAPSKNSPLTETTQSSSLSWKYIGWIESAFHPLRPSDQTSSGQKVVCFEGVSIRVLAPCCVFPPTASKTNRQELPSGEASTPNHVLALLLKIHTASKWFLATLVTLHFTPVSRSLGWWVVVSN